MGVAPHAGNKALRKDPYRRNPMAAIRRDEKGSERPKPPTAQTHQRPPEEVLERIAEMLKLARELAGHGHRPQMIEAVLHANSFHEAMDFLEQPHILRELRDA